MKKIFLLFLIFLSSCGPTGNSVTIERIKAEKEVELSKEKTNQLKIELEIEKEKNK